MAASILDETASQLVTDAQDLARNLRHRRLDSQHLFCQLALRDPGCRAWLQVAGCGDPTALASQLAHRLTGLHGSGTEHPEPSSRYVQVMFLAGDVASRCGSAEIRPAHLLEAVLTKDEELLVWLREEGYTPLLIVAESVPPLIQHLCRDLTALARQGKLSPVQGRDQELHALAESLLNPGKRNVLLLGEAGVGKTAIVELLAQKIVTGAVPQRLHNTRLFELDVNSLVAGTSYRGEFEARAQALLDEFERLPDAILFIDEFHTVISTGSNSDGGNTFANILKPALARGEITCIGATTLSEYRRYVEKDRALVRRFATLTIDEPSKEDSEAILRTHFQHVQRQRARRGRGSSFRLHRRARRSLSARP